jgi:hypothetical protein
LENSWTPKDLAIGKSTKPKGTRKSISLEKIGKLMNLEDWTLYIFNDWKLNIGPLRPKAWRQKVELNIFGNWKFDSSWLMNLEDKTQNVWRFQPWTQACNKITKQTKSWILEPSRQACKLQPKKLSK